MSRLQRLAAASGLLAVALCALAAPAASAHARLEAVSPAGGSLLRAQPARVELRFDEAVTARTDALRVLDARGRAVQAGPTTHPGGDGSRLAVALRPGLPAGTYAATYRVISADGHPVGGGSTFSVGRRGAVAASASAALEGRAEASPVRSTASAVARALAYGAIAAAVGLALFGLLVWRRAGRAADVPRLEPLLRRATLVAAGVGAAAAAALVGLEALAPGASLGEVLGTRFGHVWLAALAAWAVVALLGRVPGPARARLGALALVVLVCAPVLSGHGATQSPVGVMLPSTLLHVVAMSTWTGGLLALGLLLPLAARQVGDEARARAHAAALARFSPLALGCVGLLLATGIAQSLIIVRSPGHLVDTGTGRAVLVKLAVLAALAGLGAAHRRRTLPGLDAALGAGRGADAASARVTRAIRLEVGLVVVALAATGALAGSAPVGTTEATAATPAAVGPTSATRVLGALRVRVAVRPARAGANAVQVLLAGARGGRPAHAEEVTLAATQPAAGVGPLEATAVRRAPGRYEAPAAQLPLAGRWQLRVTVRTDDFTQVETTVPIAVR